MSKQQRLMLTVSSSIMLLMALFPPWREYSVSNTNSRPMFINSTFLGYHFVLSPPDGSSHGGMVIDSGILLAQMLFLIAIIGGFFAWFSWRAAWEKGQ